MTLTFKVDLGVNHLNALATFDDPKSITFVFFLKPMTFGLVTFGQVCILVKSEFWSSYRQKVIHKSPPCIRTGGLKK